MRIIKISDAVWSAIAERGKFGETEEDVLRRVFGVPPDNAKKSKPPTGRLGRGDKRHATKKMSVEVGNERLSIEMEGEERKSFPLHPDKSDKAGIKRVRDEAHAWARERGATQGQIDAITKALNKAGYYTRGPARPNIFDVEL